ncbi:MAG: NUDIX domain-containing protein [Patescibacteria group bacterium]
MVVGKDYVGVTTSFCCHDGKGNFLLHRRGAACRDEQGRWDGGGGKLDFGVSMEDNVLREIYEELGVNGVIQGRLPALDIFREHNGQPTHWVAIPFFILVDPSEVRINEPDKIDELGWFTLDALPSPLHTGFATIVKRYEEEFKKIARGEYD